MFTRLHIYFEFVRILLYKRSRMYDILLGPEQTPRNYLYDFLSCLCRLLYIGIAHSAHVNLLPRRRAAEILITR